MTDIRELDPTTIERIAAGEVVERPASVVKELVENSLDADASRVTVAVEAGGKAGIRVTDDGIGMSETEVRKAVEKHTTSKIRDIADLEGGVGTLGFRGEALHAIGAVSRLTVKTRPRGGERGTKLTVEGGDVTSVDPAGCPEGTTVEVDDLFYNVPARRKYLKQDGTEFAHVNTVVTGYALANPDAAVALEHDDRETFTTTGQGDLQATVMSVYGREVAESMVEVEADDMPEGPLDGVSGMVSHPETNRAGRDYLSTYVNGRYVTANAVRDAVVNAYASQLAPDRYPFAVLFLEVPPGQVDVNVHPRKLEVRFADEEGVRRQITAAVESALLREGLVRSGAPRGRSAPDQARISPARSEGDATESETDPSESDGGTPATESAVTESSPAAVPDGEEPSASASADAAVDRGSDDDAGDAFTTASSADVPPDASAASTSSTDSASGPEANGDTADDPSAASGPAAPADRPDAEPLDAAERRRSHERQSGRKFAPETTQERLGDGRPDVEYDSLPSMRVLGQFDETYVVAESDRGLLLVDQHAADERINYERLKARFEGETTTQALADPVALELTAKEAALFDDHSDALAQLGFHANRVDDRVVEVSTVPSLVAEAAGPELIRDVLSSFVQGEASAAETVEAAADALLGDLACYPSITGNTSLTEGSIVDLLSELDDCENPYACPHGRPVVIELDHGEIEDRFERDYPGHQGRRE
ncbi:DNA mismatch repair endonuclease MutL [Haloarculaceae archaeon H-GB2-1]|nr:DNA mismatch repair endonuclease MutL [Haloarculaceae archaeon H-GB1-1]MEA5406442.1 DNA mismatch repair endonuclease MutL [Haloarculaceae archaeon H-GB2-1]